MMEDSAMKRRTSTLLTAIAVALAAFTVTANAQDDAAEIRFGFHGAVNFNMVGAGAMNLARLTPSFSFIEEDLSDGQGFAPYFGAIAEYTSGDILGAALRVSVDQRTAEMEDGSSRIFTARMSYVTVEPGMRFNLGSPNFSLSAGPALAVKLASKYDYDFNGEDNQPDIAGQQINNVNNVAFGIWGDFGYDIEVRGGEGHTPIYVSPFLGVNWLVDQRKSDMTEIQDERDDVWSTVTARAGLQVKFGAEVGDGE